MASCPLDLLTSKPCRPQTPPLRPAETLLYVLTYSCRDLSTCSQSLPCSIYSLAPLTSPGFFAAQCHPLWQGFLYLKSAGYATLFPMFRVCDVYQRLLELNRAPPPEPLPGLCDLSTGTRASLASSQKLWPLGYIGGSLNP